MDELIGRPRWLEFNPEPLPKSGNNPHVWQFKKPGVNRVFFGLLVVGVTPIPQWDLHFKNGFCKMNHAGDENE